MKKSKFLGLLVLLILCVFSIYGLVGCTPQAPQFNSSSNPTFSSVGDNTSTENSENISSSINSENTSSSQESSQHSHVYKNYVYNNDATCTEDGTETGTCSCGDKYTRTSVGSARHLFGSEQARVEPTCTTTGTVAHYQCSRCEKYFNTNKVEISSIAIAKLSHKQGSEVEENRVESTCTKAGSYDLVIYCSYGCKTELSRNKKTLALVEHIAGTAVEENRVNSTCTKAGSYDSVVYCSYNCGTEISRTNKTLAKLDHVSGTAVEENKVASTCTKAGSYDSVVYCSYGCGAEISRTKKTLALASHNYGTQVAAKAATCTADGNVAHYKCSSCSQYFDTNKNQISTIVTTKLGHNYGNQVAAKAATCTTDGNVAHYKCSRCSKYFNTSKVEISSIIVAKLGHKSGSAVEENKVNSTCTKAGSYDSVVYCTNSGCGAEISRTKKTLALASHNYGTQVAAKAATCTADGNVAHYKCSSCSQYFDTNKKQISTIVTTKLGHNYGNQVAAKAATCTADGNVAHYKCSRCSKYFDTNKNQISTITTTKLGHNYGNQVAAKAATCTTDGNVAHYKCSRCSKYFNTSKVEISSIIVAKLGHNYGSQVAAKAATCTAAGNIAYYKCSTCSKYFNSSKTEVSSVAVAAKGHSYDVNKAQVNAGAFTSGTIAYKHCSSCNKTFNSSGTDITGQSLYIAPTSGFKTVKGSFSKGSGQVITTATKNSIALYAGVETVSKTSATLTVRIKHNAGPIGLVFNYTDANNYYKFVADDSTANYSWGEDKIRLIRVKGGTETELYSNYLSAGYWSGNTNGGEGGDPFTFKLVIKNNVAYCYFWKTLYITQSLDMSGSGIGIYSGVSSTVTYNSYTYSSSASVDTCNTLLFGHSYFEMWRKWQSDFTTISNNCSGFGSFIDIGIGGSVAQHWYNMRSTLLKYNFNNVVFMIGINDISGSYTPAQAFSYVKQTLDYLKQQKSGLKAILVGVAQCPARDHIKNLVSELNVLYKQYALENDWINYVECEWMFTDSNGYVMSDFLDDQLHPSDSAYTNKLAPAIQKAWTGGFEGEILDHLKYAKSLTLDVYSKNTYRAKEWESAQSIYNEAISAINNCKTYAQFKALSLDSYIGNLNRIFTHADYAFYNILENSPASVTSDGGSFYSYASWENPAFRDTLETSYSNKSDPATGASQYNLTSYGHRLDTSVSYTDISFTFSFSNGPTTNNAGTDGTDKVGILFRATQNPSTLGVTGYAITYVRDAEGDGTDYFQILSFNNCYSTAFNGTCRYLGGWVYKGNAENKTFRAVISGNTCYIYEESMFQAYGTGAYGCYAFLDRDAGGSGVTLISSGYWGLMNWGTHTAKVTVDNITGSAIHAADVERAHNLIYSMSTGTNCVTNAGGFGTGAGPFIESNGKGFRVSKDKSYTNITLTFSLDADQDIEFTGIVLRASVTANNGITGYLLEPASVGTMQKFRIWKITNACSGSNEGYTCIAEWDFSANPRGLKYIVKLNGSSFTVTIENYPGVTLTHTDSSITGSGYFGVFVNGNRSFLKVHNVTYS